VPRRGRRQPRGSSSTILPSPRQAGRAAKSGTSVVLPAPGGADQHGARAVIERLHQARQHRRHRQVGELDHQLRSGLLRRMDGKPGNIRHERGEATSQHPDKVAQGPGRHLRE
jgi:hypothetical protein